MLESPFARYYFVRLCSGAERLIRGWVTSAPPKDHAVEIRKHIERSRIRFGKEPRRTPIDPNP